MKRFEGKCVMITGASVGIGQACAEQFAKDGANLVLADVDLEKLEILAKTLQDTCQVRVLFALCDVSNDAAVRKLVSDACEAFGRIDILVNNAGIWRRFMPFTETTSEMWKKYIDVNILGTMYCTHAVLPGMLSAGWGRVINVGSVAGVYGNANMVDYSTTKGAVIAFTKALAKEVSPKGVTVNCVSPGSVSNHQDEIEPSELSFMGRTGTHTENANMICFLASDEAAYISGQNIQVDGCRKKM
ncbi:MAG: SDR family oxidoreductase [Clostridia bacterium]|nr:SDR family oxidoreductase [Clostridia bacterium]